MSFSKIQGLGRTQTGSPPSLIHRLGLGSSCFFAPTDWWRSPRHVVDLDPKALALQDALVRAGAAQGEQFFSESMRVF